MLRESRAVLRSAINALARAVAAGSDACRDVARAIDGTVNGSVVGSMLPLLASAVGVVASSTPSAIFATLGDDVGVVSQLLAEMSGYASAVGRAGGKGEEKVGTVKASVRSTVSKWVESKHEYGARGAG